MVRSGVKARTVQQFGTRLEEKELYGISYPSITNCVKSMGFYVKVTAVRTQFSVPLWKICNHKTSAKALRTDSPVNVDRTLYQLLN